MDTVSSIASICGVAGMNLFRHLTPMVREKERWMHHIGLSAFLVLICILSSQAQDVDRTQSVLETTASQPIVANERNPLITALKTNALLDLLAIPNAGLEISLGNRWSMAVNGHYAWWKSDPRSWYWRTYGGDIALRRWFGRKNKEILLTGHHAGIYGQMLTYDFATGGRGYLADKWTYGAGVEYGYSLPIRKRLNIDFSLGVGYLGGEYKEYLPMDGHYVWQVTRNRHWFGPSKAEISLVWLLGGGNRTSEKGSSR